MAYDEKRDGKTTGFFYGEVLLKKTGKRFRRRFETRKAAEGYEAYVRATGEEPATLNDAKLIGPTFAETVKAMRAAKGLEAPRKKVSKDSSSPRRLDWLVNRLGHLTFAAIDTSKLDEVVADLEKRPAQMNRKARIGDTTINRYLSAFSAVRTFAVARVKPDEKPLPALVIPWRKEAGNRIHWFSQAQEDVLVPWMRAKGWLVEATTLRVLCATGMRWGEFEGLEGHQCQPEWVLLDETKTDTPRDIPMDVDLAAELKAMVVSRTLPKYWQMRRRLKEAVKACGYSPKLGLHNARHGTATRHVKNGTPLPVVQKFLGHKNIKTTMKYVHVEADDLMQAMKNLNPRRGETPQNAAPGEVVPFMKSTG